jgi:hypothetical protein
VVGACARHHHAFTIVTGELGAMFRRVLLCAVLTLAALPAMLPAAAHTPDRGAEAGAAARGMTSRYAVYYRRAGTVEWSRYRNYGSAQEAKAAAQDLYQKGWEVEISARITLTHVPARPKAGLLPISQTVTAEQARQAFRWMASQKDIAFRYPTDGCYARAHLMVRRLQQRGLKPWKVWSFANGGEKLYVRTPNHPKGHVEWRYHVAPILRVRLANNQQRWWVIDPALFKGPVAISTWRNTQKRPQARYNPYVTITRLGVAPTDATKKKLPGTGYWPGPDPKEGVDNHAVKMMRRYKPFQGKMPPRTVAQAAVPNRLPLFALPADNRRLVAA